MDVDAQTGHVGAASKDEELELASLARLEAVANSPYNAELHLDNIAHSTSAQAKEEARQFMASVLLLPEEIWMSWIDDRKQSVTSAADVDGALAVIELYQRSMADMLCKSAASKVDITTANIRADVTISKSHKAALRLRKLHRRLVLRSTRSTALYLRQRSRGYAAVDNLGRTGTKRV